MTRVCFFSDVDADDKSIALAITSSQPQQPVSSSSSSNVSLGSNHLPESPSISQELIKSGSAPTTDLSKTPEVWKFLLFMGYERRSKCVSIVLGEAERGDYYGQRFRGRGGDTKAGRLCGHGDRETLEAKREEAAGSDLGLVDCCKVTPSRSLNVGVQI